MSPQEFREDVLVRLARIEQGVETLKGLEDRVVSLEKWRSWLAGAAAVLGALTAYVHFPKLKI